MNTVCMHICTFHVAAVSVTTPPTAQAQPTWPNTCELMRGSRTERKFWEQIPTTDATVGPTASCDS